MSQRKGGIIGIKINGVVYDVKGEVTYNLGHHKRDAIIGQDGVHGFMEKPQVPFVETEFTDRVSLDVGALLDLEDATVQVSLANGKDVILREAWFASEGDVGTAEGNIKVRFEGKQAEEVG